MYAEPIILAFVLTLVHYASEWFERKIERYHAEIVSLSAGLFTAFIFMKILPELVKGEPVLGQQLYFFLLSGFVAFHLVEKYVYQHVTDKYAQLHDLGHLHIAGFIIDAFVVGFTLVLLFKINLSYLAFVPYVLHTISSTLSLRDIHIKYDSGKKEKVLLALSPVLGAITASLLGFTQQLFFTAFAFVVGVLMYIVIRGIIPSNEKGMPLYFVFGIVISFAMLSMAGM